MPLGASVTPSAGIVDGSIRNGLVLTVAGYRDRQGKTAMRRHRLRENRDALGRLTGSCNSDFTDRLPTATDASSRTSPDSTAH